MATDAITKQVEKKTRQRSPNYPTVSLQDALERVRRLFNEDGRASVPVETAAKHIGYAAAHGQAYSVISALKKYGLLEENKGRVALSQRAIELLNLPASDPRRLQALKDAALSPPIYRELVELHSQKGLPSDEALEAELVTYKSFNPKAVAGFVRDFRATLEFAGLSDFSVLGSEKKVDEGKKTPQIGDWVQWEHNGILGLPDSRKLLRFSENGQFGFVEGSDTGLPVSEIIPADPPEQMPPFTPSSPLHRMADSGKRDQGAKMRQDVFSLAEGEAVIHWPTPLSTDSIADLEEWLDLVKRKIKRSAAIESADKPTD
jgi:hypothetical protein